MKKILLLSSCLAIGLSTISFADDASSTMTPPDSSNAMKASAPTQAKNRPCLNIAVACENAGYRLSTSMPGKNIWKDCVKPIVGGTAVSGVSAASADIQACKTKMAQKKMKHMEMKQQQQSSTMQPQDTMTSAPQQ